MLLRLVVWRSRYILCAASNTPAVKHCTPHHMMLPNITVKLFRRGLAAAGAGNANRHRQCVCDPKYVVYDCAKLPNDTFAVPCIICCRRGHSYHTSTVSFLASKYDGKSSVDDIPVPGVNLPSSGKQRDDENVEDLVNESASVVPETGTDCRAALAVNEIELEEQTPSLSVSEADVLSERETQGKADNEEVSRNFSKGESEPIDIDKELLKYDYEEFDDVYFEPEAEEIEEPTFPISLERGVTGVFDVSELVTVLREENGRDICVIAVPKVMNYVDHLVLVTGRSTRHITALAEYVRWLYKRKRRGRDPLTCKIEGIDTCKDWYAIDLGNIAVHMFMKATRDTYDLETLWSVGRDYDEKMSEATADPFASLFTHEDFVAKFAHSRSDKDDPLTAHTAGSRDTDQPIMEQASKKTIDEGMENIAGWHDITHDDRKEDTKT